MNTLIISGGNINHDFALDFIKENQFDTIIAVDRGMVFAHQYRVPVHYIVGDFDSAPDEILQYYQQQGQSEICAYNPEKDATDTHIAIEKAIEIKSKSICILGATGGRLDHCLGNLNCLSLALDAEIPAAMVDEYNHISLLKTGVTLNKEEQFGNYVSFLPLGDEVTGLTLEGFKYPLSNYTLRTDQSIGISNEIQEQTGRVSFLSGILIKIESRD